MDDMDTGFFLMRAFAGPMMAVVTAMVSLTIFAPIVLYVLARWRANRDPHPDTQLGVKVALHYFSLSAFHLALAGATLLLWAMISTAPSEFKGGFYRVAFGMLVPAALVLGAHMSLLRKTNDEVMPGVRRLFLGYNLIVTGLIGFISLVLAFQALFAKGSSGEVGRIAGAMVLVYGSAWAVIGWRFGTLALRGTSGFGDPPSNIVTPSAPPPAAAASGLPSLGGGSFPPIEPQ